VIGDVAVNGGGPAGCAAAIALAGAGRRVLIVEAPESRRHAGVESLPPGARPLLRDLGCWPDTAGHGITPVYANESSWGSSEVARTDFTRDPNGHGWHVDRAVFDDAMLSTACARGAAVVHDVATSVQRVEGQWRIATASRDGIIAAPWIIDASGRRADLARSLGIERVSYDALVAVVAIVRRRDGGADPDRTSFVEAVPDGWWYTATDAAGSRVMACFSDASSLTSRRAATEAGFAALWEQTAHLRVRVVPGDHVFAQAPHVSPAATTRLGCAGGAGWLAAGDAVATLDPISSQGVLSAAFTGLRAAECILRAGVNGEGVVEEYEEVVDRFFSAYLTQRRDCYLAERRWADRPFWRVRHAPPVAGRASAPAIEDPLRQRVEL
jgi:flavin-dependent dehydrogenase